VADPWDEWRDVRDELIGLDPRTHGELFTAAVDREMTLQIGLAVREHVSLDQVLHLTVFGLTGVSMPPGASTSSLIDRIENAIADARRHRKRESAGSVKGCSPGQ
jgi:hypothetical protein